MLKIREENHVNVPLRPIQIDFPRYHVPHGYLEKNLPRFLAIYVKNRLAYDIKLLQMWRRSDAASLKREWYQTDKKKPWIYSDIM